MHSPWKGASFFESVDVDVSSECSSCSVSIGKSRGAHSPGPRNPLSPLRVKVDVEDSDDEDEKREAEERLGAAAVTRSKQRSESGWKSPLRSPFKGGLFGRGNKNGDAGAAPFGSE